MFDNPDDPEQWELATWLAQVATGTEDWNDLLAEDAVTRVRWLRKRGWSPQQCGALLELLDCRQRATAKFDNAHDLLLTRRSYEQASGRELARWKRDWLAEAVNGRPAVLLDLCCGAGGDALPMLSRFPVVAIDRDRILAEFCRHNLTRTVSNGGNSNPAFVACDDVNRVVGQQPATNFGQWARQWGGDLWEWCQRNQLQDHQIVWHLDPDRRSERGRHIRMEDFSPAVAFLKQLVDQFPVGMVKVAPATQLTPSLQQKADWLWMGNHRESKQLVGAFGRSAGQRGAIIWNPRRNGWDQSLGPVEAWEESVTRPLRPQGFLIDFHSAMTLSGRDRVEANRWGAHRVAQDGYYQTDRLDAIDPGTAAYSLFQVIAVLPWKLKQIKRELQARHLRLVEVKKRQVSAQLQQKAIAALQDDFSRASQDHASLLLVHQGNAHRAHAVLARRVIDDPLN